MLALISVLLVTLAQLLLRSAMVNFPTTEIDLPNLFVHARQPLLLLSTGLVAYGVSMLCWIVALRYSALNRLYPLLSLSYVLVWLAAISLPHFHEPFRWSGLAGVGLIVLGVLAVSLTGQRK